ncbi:hypothetical protein Ppro_3398 [Pelobacter propionicus DSM 2379]|uniref:Uncharacterized protein n=2 Tax=Pelobacter propionicus TaxID=29543 RepID=A1AUH0_PELPD|nr:hypothetical protein Ppro_3398 [Pelobacter propionicus DSM 2379]
MRDFMDIVECRSRLKNWLDALSDGLQPGRFRFCLGGSFVPTNGKEALVSTCYAMKAAWQSTIWDEWPKERKDGCIHFIQSFQNESGFFFDPWLDRQSSPSNWIEFVKFVCQRALGRGLSIRELKIRNVRAETRQSAASLLMIGAQLKTSLPLEATTPSEVRSYLEQFDWSQPWAAGSHLSHLIFFIAANKLFVNNAVKFEELIDEIEYFLLSIWNAEHGAWFNGRPSDQMKINGAMKILTGFQWLDRSYPDCRKLMDLALSLSFESDGCGFVNRLFVVHEAQKGVPLGYRDLDVHDLALKALEEIEKFFRMDGGFSFYVHGAQTHYYGAHVSDGRLVGDLHGAAMITWGIALSLALLGESDITDANQWRVHRP